MSIVFSAADRLAITRRQLKIDQENDALQSAVNTFNDQQNALLQVDGSNQKFYDFYNGICQAYENEARQMNGQIPDTYTASDLTAAAATPSIPPFFPSSPTPAYTRSIPLIQDGIHTNNKVKGFFHPIGTDPRYEQNILNNTVVPSGLQQMIFRLNNGISATPPGLVTTTTAIPAGNIASLTVAVPSTTNFSVGQLVYINQGTASGLYEIIALVPGSSLTIKSIIPTQTGMPTGGTIDNDVPAFTATERQTLSSTLYNELLNQIATGIFNLVNEWEGKIDNMITILTANQDNRTPYAAQNTAALTAVNTTKNIITTWKALPATGPTGRYVAASILPISTEVSNRLSFIPTRISQITAALGSSSSNALTQSGDTFTTAVPNNPYYNRYKWLNYRINRMSGSLRRYYAADQSKGITQQLLNDNNSIKNEYNSYFLTKGIIFNDGSDILHVKNLTGLSVGDTITIVSETQPEITRTIVQLLGTTQIKLNAPVPKTYTVADLARIFKTL